MAHQLLHRNGGTMNRESIHQLTQMATPIVDSRAVIGVGTASGAAFLGFNAEELSQSLQIVATFGGIIVSMVTAIYVFLGIVERIKRLRTIDKIKGN